MVANGTCLLIIEDDENIAAMLAEFFQLKDFDVVVTCSGEQGWRTYTDRLPDVVILSGELPDIPGLALAEKIRQFQSKRRRPVIVITDKKQPLQALEVAGLQPDDQIIKPFDLLELGRRIYAKLAAPTDIQLAASFSQNSAVERLEEQLGSLMSRESWAVLKVAILNLPLFNNMLGPLAQADLLAAIQDIIQGVISSCQDFGYEMLQQPTEGLFIIVVPPGDIEPISRIITKNLNHCFDYFYVSEQSKERLQVAVSAVQSSDRQEWDKAGLLAALLQSNL
jgi:CheY-like chemotaxis protein